MKIAIDEIRSYMTQALRIRGFADADASFIVNDFIEAEEESRPTHGIGRFLLIDHALDNRRGSPVVTTERPSLVHIDGRGELGQLAARFAADHALRCAAATGVGIATLTNASRYSRLSPYARRIADGGYVALVMNNAGPPAVAPYGSRDPVLGTNPICFGFPATAEPLVIDFATSERVWGEIRQAALTGQDLPPNAFLDAAGNPTLNPHEVEAVLSFGEQKGSALCIAVELLAGTLAAAKVGSAVETEYELGAIFMAIGLPPALGLSGAQRTTDALAAEVRNSAPLPGHDSVRMPGDQSRLSRRKVAEANAIEMDEKTLDILKKMSTSRDGGLESSHKLD